MVRSQSAISDQELMQLSTQNPELRVVPGFTLVLQRLL